jgi:hypothetical protein
MSNHALTQCIQCGQTDDHPKSHWSSGETYHHDCLPFAKKTELIESHPHGESIIAAAEAGTHGDDLRSHIVALAKENS